MTVEKNQEHLADEYMQLQKTVEDFDGKALTIKAWSVTLSAAGLVAAYIENEPAVLLVASGSAVIFWMVEALWKINQNAFYSRIYQIEEAFRNQATDFSPYQIASGWSRSWRSGKRERKVLQVMAWPHVFLPHIVVAVCGLALYFWLPPS
ncbi:hypothetical protein M3P21_19200 [Ruegeria sp. 2012CJ41-6]|uniref:SMODS and SLOG-associating 2TM effector domain-containing protein n=1 Tax=Ruegeria spongiae TaxID=2942209 RepID=A0ABT0Q763_9RHOB|nr:hypothetical protein [Ruegeria spongiae]MCL6285660.1 hypothetical protein [Ruegeria spongiae]